MSVNDPISISPQQMQEGRSTGAIKEALSPWLVNWVQQGNDFGLDGWVQIVDENNTGGGSVSPLTFHIQAKSHQHRSTEPFGISIECRHLGNWTGGPGTVLIAAYSATDGQIVFRTARQAVAELDATNIGWREQASTTVRFRPEHLLTGPAGRRTIRRWVADEADMRRGRPAIPRRSEAGPVDGPVPRPSRDIYDHRGSGSGGWVRNEDLRWARVERR